MHLHEPIGEMNYRLYFILYNLVPATLPISVSLLKAKRGLLVNGRRTKMVRLPHLHVYRAHLFFKKIPFNVGVRRIHRITEKAQKKNSPFPRYLYEIHRPMSVWDLSKSSNVIDCVFAWSPLKPELICHGSSSGRFVIKDYFSALKLQCIYGRLLLLTARMEMDWNLKTLSMFSSSEMFSKQLPTIDINIVVCSPY